MRPLFFAIAMMCVPAISHADTPDALIGDVVNGHILPRFEALAENAQTLSDVAAEGCDPTSIKLRTAFGNAFDSWITASHLRFGPSEVGDRAFTLAFWPDSRGATPRALSALLAEQDPIALSPDDYTQVSIAARGFYALEYLLYDAALMSDGAQDYHCLLVQTISADIAATSQKIYDDWQSDYAAAMQTPAQNGVYRSTDEILQEIFKSLSTGLEFTADTRLGRPLGTFDRPRPTRAEVHRSGRSARHVMLSLQSLQDLATRLAESDADLSVALNAAFEKALAQLSNLNDPTFAGVSRPQSRLKVEVIQQSVQSVRALAREKLGPKLGVAAGFNSLDGD